MSTTEDLLEVDNSLIQAERHLKHAQIHLRDARMMVDDDSYQLGLTPADRTELGNVLRFLTETVETILFSGEKTRPILDRSAP